MEHLKAMGESTAALNRQFSVGRDTFLAAASIYQELYGLEDGTIPATFQVFLVSLFTAVKINKASYNLMRKDYFGDWMEPRLFAANAKEERLCCGVYEGATKIMGWPLKDCRAF